MVEAIFSACEKLSESLMDAMVGKCTLIIFKLLKYFLLPVTLVLLLLICLSGGETQSESRLYSAPASSRPFKTDSKEKLDFFFFLYFKKKKKAQT